ncbi:hypothetical protein CVT26_006909 [Gymnopilus dilepis]|uniref:Uncharacterized protein n=1 Tax=Gymnopilus dilepis TaxID=231916 RepID=A0A409W114_9AGAR|nr:hypothetical protein CVT26_006909 [Gymnopilus dilepis]
MELVLGYLTLLSILTIAKRREDSTIWHCSVRKFPLASTQHLKSPPTSPLPRFRSRTPVILAPTPRHAVVNQEPILSYRSGLSLEYEIEHYQSPTVAFLSPISRQEPSEDPAPSAPLPAAPLHSEPPLSRPEQVQRPAQIPTPSPFYHSAVRSAIEDQPGQPQAPPPAHTAVRRLPPSPPPLGDWPRLDATSRPRTMKRKPLPQPSHPQPEPSGSHPPQRRPSRPLPPPLSQPQPQPLPQPQPSPSYVFDASALAAALQPIASQSQSRRSKPSGPRRKSTSIDEGRPPLDFSDFRNSRSQGFS